MFRWSATPRPKVVVPRAAQFCGFLSIYAYPRYALCRTTTKFDVVTHMGRGVYRGSVTPAIATERSSRAFSILMFSCICACTF